MKKVKQIEKNIEKKHEQKETINYEWNKLLILIGVVIVIFAIFYAITAFINSKPQKQDSEIMPETIQYKQILVGQMLNRTEKSYFVLVEEEDNVYNDLYISYLEAYISDNKDTNYYTVSLSDPLNQQYVGTQTNVKGKDIAKFKFSETTLVQIKKGKVEKVYANQEEILNAIKKLVK